MKKTCKRCKEEKDIEEFYKIRQKKRNGEGYYYTRHSYCKQCQKEYRAERYGKTDYDKKYHLKNQDKILSYQRKHYEENKEYIQERNRNNYVKKKEYYKKNHKKWVEENREASRAHGAVTRAKKKGILKVPDACECCGREVRLEAHHHGSYEGEGALQVLFICRKCHRRHHRGQNSELTKKLDKLHEEKYGKL